MKEEMIRVMNIYDDLFLLFIPEELKEALLSIKMGKASGLDGTSAEIIKHFGNKAFGWLLALFNNCALNYQSPKIWSKAGFVAHPETAKDPKDAKSYRRPIGLSSWTQFLST